MEEDELNKIWNTKTLTAWSSKNFDKILFSSNIKGTETYITKGTGKDTVHIEGYEAIKQHKGDSQPTTYFIRSEDIKNIPLIIKKTTKMHCRQKVYNVITEGRSVSIKPEQKMSWRQLINLSGIPHHTDKASWTRYKMKRLYGRLTGQFYQRAVSESGFGKDKYPEAIRILINSMGNISDPSRAKLFYSACHNKDITINELGVPNGNEQYEYFNQCMRIGDATQILDNPKRATNGTSETIHIDKLSVAFTHNVASYYHVQGKKCFEEIYPYNVNNRYYYNLYTGYSQMKPKPRNITFDELAEKYDGFIKDWIKTALWFENNLHKLPNKFPNISLDVFVFDKKEDRFKNHFEMFAHCVSYYARNEREYLMILKQDYDNNMSYKDKIGVLVSSSEKLI